MLNNNWLVIKWAVKMTSLCYADLSPVVRPLFWRLFLELLLMQLTSSRKNLFPINPRTNLVNPIN